MAKISSALFFSMMLALSAGLAGANAVYAYVDGIVHDPSNIRIPGAHVTAVCLNNSLSFNKTTDQDGFYFGGFVCPINTTVQVTATKNNATGTATGTVHYLDTDQFGNVTVDIGLAYIDVQIPEYPTAAAPVLLSVLSFGLLRMGKR